MEQTSQVERGYSADQAAELRAHLLKLRNAHASVKMEMHHLAGQLTVQRARMFAYEGVGRRLGVIERAVLNTYRIYPPDRRHLLSVPECIDVGIQLHAFAINVYALFDNIAWVCVLEAGAKVDPRQVGPFKPASQAAIPKVFRDYLARPNVREWFERYGKEYRDSTAHRIPPYLPSREFTEEEGARWKELDAEAMRTLREFDPAEGHADARLERHRQLNEEKEQLGVNSQLMVLSIADLEAGPPVLMHPQLLSDWELVQDSVREFAKAMRAEKGLPALMFPEVVVNGPI